MINRLKKSAILVSINRLKKSAILVSITFNNLQKPLILTSVLILLSLVYVMLIWTIHGVNISFFILYIISLCSNYIFPYIVLIFTVDVFLSPLFFFCSAYWIFLNNVHTLFFFLAFRYFLIFSIIFFSILFPPHIHFLPHLT